jgi:hypothetical protein
MPDADHTIHRLPNGEVRIICNGRVGTVSSEHLVPGKLAQLRCHGVRIAERPTEFQLCNPPHGAA